MSWIDTHCHLDAAEFDADRDAVRQQAQLLGVDICVIPAVMASHFDEVRLLAHRHADAYALGIHPLYTPQASDSDLASLDTHLHAHRDDPRLVAVGEIGLDGFVPDINTPEALAKQTHFFEAQLQLAQRHQLPVILHVRRSADGLLKGLRKFPVVGGIAHAFNGSLQQAQMFIEMGFKLGFGGAMTFERATKLRALATELPLSALVLETDAPDIPPHWIYTTAEDREKGAAQGRNSPTELPRIASVLAELRGISLEALAVATSANARQALPRLQSPA
jgi:TatD DNase family protein